MKRRKFGNIKTAGLDSKAESRRIAKLRLMELAGEISELRTQVKFELIPAQYIGGKCVERAITYKADAAYLDKAGNLVVEDVKSPATKTQQYVIRRKLMLFVHGIQVVEVMN